MRTRLWVTVLLWAGTGSGCAVVGLVASPTASEKKIPAEFNFATRPADKVLVLVDQPPWVEVESDLRRVLTENINELLITKAHIGPARLISYDELAQFRRGRADFKTLLPVEVGTSLEARLLLWVQVADCELYELPARGYYNGSLTVRAALFDIPTGFKLWPDTADAKQIKVSIPAERGGPDAVAEKLAKAASQCVVRYFYDCPSNKFRVWPEELDSRWQE
jgi:hypothetical protein